MIIGGVCPATPQTLTAGKQIGADYFLERRELGLINSGPGGAVTVDGAEYRLAQDTEISDILLWDGGLILKILKKQQCYWLPQPQIILLGKMFLLIAVG